MSTIWAWLTAFVAVLDVGQTHPPLGHVRRHKGEILAEWKVLTITAASGEELHRGGSVVLLAPALALLLAAAGTTQAAVRRR